MRRSDLGQGTVPVTYESVYPVLMRYLAQDSKKPSAAAMKFRYCAIQREASMRAGINLSLLALYPSLAADMKRIVTETCNSMLAVPTSRIPVTIYELYKMSKAAIKLSSYFYDVVMLALTLMYCGFGLRPCEATYAGTITQPLLFGDLKYWRKRSTDDYIVGGLPFQKTKSQPSDAHRSMIMIILSRTPELNVFEWLKTVHPWIRARDDLYREDVQEYPLVPDLDNPRLALSSAMLRSGMRVLASEADLSYPYYRLPYSIRKGVAEHLWLFKFDDSSAARMMRWQSNDCRVNLWHRYGMSEPDAIWLRFSRDGFSFDHMSQGGFVHGNGTNCT